MKEIIAVVRMNKTGATKQALVESGVAGFTAIKVEGRGKLVTNPTLISDRKKELLMMAGDDETGEAEKLITDFLVGTSLFPRRLFTILAHDEDVTKIVQAIILANKTCNNVGDGKIFVLPVSDVVRVRTGETGESAV
ncbi:P-II family nitrogen regulator [Pelosinus sp. sgz500959]|uniref:P-II family nitrogen regulator n=1 Tax=Pelosinus sp. sgz500959 TaxID=3242472 RepID=UPI00366F8F32